MTETRKQQPGRDEPIELEAESLEGVRGAGDAIAQKTLSGDALRLENETSLVSKQDRKLTAVDGGDLTGFELTRPTVLD